MKPLTLGILGGGQLGRMSALAAARLGIKTVIFTPETDSPASHVAFKTFVAEYEDERALREFSESVHVISYEFENIPIKTIQYLEKLKPVYPDKTLLEIAQDRITEKSTLNALGIPTARWATPQSAQEAQDILKQWGASACIFKTTRMGYDGKGQARFTAPAAMEPLWDTFNSTPLIMEEVVDFTKELSVIVARDFKGKTEYYGPMWNEHHNHILSRTQIPAPVPEHLAEQARAMTRTLAEAVHLRGVLTLELFLARDGTLLANEIAPRTHNSGHWSIEACVISQFENHVRAVCGLPVAPPARHSDAEMLNILGENIKDMEKFLDEPHTAVHHYGKQEPRTGRKMGHITRLLRKET